MEEIMNETSDSHGDLASEFRRLGQNLKEALQAAWDSEERRRLEKEIEAGLSDAADALRGAAKEFSASPAGQHLREELHDLGQRVRTGELETKVRQDVVGGLRALNAELERAAGTWRSKDKASGTSESGTGTDEGHP
jgi:HAMP domain-containing protein